MLLKIDDLEFNLLLDQSNLTSNKLPVLFLHGFTGCADDWKFILEKLPTGFYPLAIDLIGHGQSSKPESIEAYSTSANLLHINRILAKLKISKMILCGYSMGGRAAISFALKYPHKILAAVFESTTAGIEDFEQKKERVEFDLLLADKIKLEGVESFLNYWLSTPMFESLKDATNVDELKGKRKKNDVIGLANSLAGFSSGLMPSCWDKLDQINFPVLLISGANDLKYTEINKKMNSRIKNSRHIIVANSGHNVHLEKPDVFSKFVSEFLTSLN